jgi:hypothetical protein
LLPLPAFAGRPRGPGLCCPKITIRLLNPATRGILLTV